MPYGPVLPVKIRNWILMQEAEEISKKVWRNSTSSIAEARLTMWNVRIMYQRGNWQYDSGTKKTKIDNLEII